MTALARLLPPQVRDLGDFAVERLLPAPGCRAVGPFVFLDHFGPVAFAPGRGMDVRPHPHVGLATVTFLFEGGIVHRDSLGSHTKIIPGDVNWMTAGRGIVHSERSDPADRARGMRLHGLQFWVALPRDREDAEPAFVHVAAADLPRVERAGARITVVVGAAFGLRSPAPSEGGVLLAFVDLAAGATLALPDAPAERALLPLDGNVLLDGHALVPRSLAVLAEGAAATLAAPAGGRAMLLGGPPLDGPREMFWNFVATSRERIEAAKARWRDQAFGRVPGDDEFIPLP